MMSVGPQFPPNLPVAGHSPVVSGPPNPKPGKALAIVSLVLSIISVPICFLSSLAGLVFLPLCIGHFISMPLALAGAIIGFIGLKKVKAGTASGKGLAMGGMITGIAVIVLYILAIVVIVLVVGAAGLAALFDR